MKQPLRLWKNPLRVLGHGFHLLADPDRAAGSASTRLLTTCTTFCPRDSETDGPSRSFSSCLTNRAT